MNNMKSKQFYLKWFVVIPLAIIGLLALLFLVTRLVTDQTYKTTYSHTGGYAEMALVSDYAEPMVASRSFDSFGIEESFNGSIDSAAEIGQKIIKTGSLTLVVDSVLETISSFTDLAAQAEGYIQYSSTSELEDGTYTGNLTMRIPSDSFESSMESMKASATFVEYESVSGTDVTEEYTDYLARLSNAEAEEVAYLAVLDKATSVEDILAVQAALSDVREEIEIIEGRLQYLEDRTSFSTISVYLSEEASVIIPSKEFRPWNAVKEAARSFVALVQQSVIALIWIVIVGGGILLPLALLAWIGRKLFVVCKKKCKSKRLKR